MVCMEFVEIKEDGLLDKAILMSPSKSSGGGQETNSMALTKTEMS